MIEETVISYLNTNMSVPCYGERRKEVTYPFILVERTSGTITNHIKSCTIAVQSYAESMAQACQLNEEVKECLLGIITLNEIASCRLVNDYNFTNSQTKEYRYQAVFSLTYY